SRPAFVAAALTIARAFVVAGRPRGVAPIGSFEDWSTWVRDPLIWLGRADPAAAMGNAQRDNPDVAKLVAVLETWARVIGDSRVAAREVVELAGKQSSAGGWLYPDFRDALLVVARDRGEVSSDRLGRWLGKIKGRLMNGKRVVSAEKLHGIAR